MQSLRPVISCARVEMSPDVHASLRGLEISDQLGVPAHVRLEFSLVPGSAGLTPPPIYVGNELLISVDGADDSGAPVSGWTIFDGLVTGVGLDLDTGTTQTYVVEGYDRLFLLGRATLTKKYLKSKASDIIKNLISGPGMTARIAAGFDTKAPAPDAFQFGTAYAYIDRLVRDAGFEWRVDGSELIIEPRSTAGTSHTLTVGKNLLRFTARLSAAEHVADVEVSGWDAAKKERIVGSAASSGKFGGSSAPAATTDSIKGSAVAGSKLLSLPHPVRDKDHADQLATGLMAERESSLLRARGEAEPSPGIAPGTTLELVGLADDWSGEYRCTGVEHRWGATGSFRTVFEVGQSSPTSLLDVVGGSGPALENMLQALTVGIVTNNEDPDKLNRVKVTFPYLSDSEESAWARVLQPGGGKSRGWTVMPEVGDEVLIGFEHGDIDHPYVLGGLTNSKDTAPYTATGGIVENGQVVARTMTSRLGHEIFMADGADAADQFVLVRTAGDEAVLNLAKERVDLIATNTPLKIQNDKGSIEIDKDGNITIKGAKITLQGTGDITVDGKTNVNVKAGAGAKVEATAALDLKSKAPATLESSAITNVKGSMVKIN